MSRLRIKKYERVDVFCSNKGKGSVSTSVFQPLSKEKLEQQREAMSWNMDKKDDAWHEHARKEKSLNPDQPRFKYSKNKVIYTPMK